MRYVWIDVELMLTIRKNPFVCSKNAEMRNWQLFLILKMKTGRSMVTKSTWASVLAFWPGHLLTEFQRDGRSNPQHVGWYASTCRGLECTKSVKWYYINIYTYCYIFFIFTGGFGGFCTFRMLCATESYKRPIMWSWGLCLSFDGIWLNLVSLCVILLGGRAPLYFSA